MDYLSKLIGEIEIHSVSGIRECFLNGVHPNDLYCNKPLIDELTSEYLRSPRFKDCIQVFVDFGLVFDDKALLAVLRNDAASLTDLLGKDPGLTTKKYTLRCAFTPLYEATLLHICAEFNHVACAKVLVACGADLNARAGVDNNGFGGQTPVFHTVNQIRNQSWDMLLFLLGSDVDLHLTVAGLIWGKGYEWETLIPAVNPVSYAMMGLLPQMHRKDTEIARTISLLLKAAYNIEYMPTNVPNKYLG